MGNMVTDLQNTLYEKQSAMNEIFQKDQIDYDLKISIDTLEGHISMLLDKRYQQQSIIEDYRYSLQECLNSLDNINKVFVESEQSQDINNQERLEKLKGVKNDYEEVQNAALVLEEKAKFVLQEIGDMDQQQVTEQSNSIKRRVVDLKKRMERKIQLIEMAKSGYENTKTEIDDIGKWFEQQYSIIDGFIDNIGGKETISEMKTKVREIEGQRESIETLENKVETISSDLQGPEYEELKKKLNSLSTEQKKLLTAAKEKLKHVVNSSNYQKKFESEFDTIMSWMKAKSTDHSKGSEYTPCKSYAIEKKIAILKKDMNEITEYEESSISQLKLGLISLQKSENETIKAKSDKYEKEVESSLKLLKDNIKVKITHLEESLTDRRDFEAKYDKCVLWLDQADSTINTEVRGTINI